MRQQLLDYALPFILSFSRSHAFPSHISTTANSPGQWRLIKIYWRYADLSGCWHLCRCPTQGVCALWHLSVPVFSQQWHYLQNKIWFILGDARAQCIALRALISITDYRPLAPSEAIVKRAWKTRCPAISRAEIEKVMSVLRVWPVDMNVSERLGLTWPLCIPPPKTGIMSTLRFPSEQLERHSGCHHVICAKEIL